MHSRTMVTSRPRFYLLFSALAWTAEQGAGAPAPPPPPRFEVGGWNVLQPPPQVLRGMPLGPPLPQCLTFIGINTFDGVMWRR